MPTTNPRLKVTLTEEQHELLRRLAAQQGVSMSSILVDLFETAAPVLKRVADLVDTASKANDAFRHDLLQSMEAAEKALAPAVQLTQEAFQEITDSAERSAEKAGARGRAPARGKGPRAPASPPSSNTGVRSPRNSRKRGVRHAL